MRVLLVSTFGSPAYGVSPYADELLQALRCCQGKPIEDQVEALDFQSAYPRSLHPANMPKRKRRAGLHWAKPWTWSYAGPVPDIVHIQYWTAITAPYLLSFAKGVQQRGSRVVLTLHNTKPHEKSGLLGVFERQLIYLSDAVITHAREDKLECVLCQRHYVVPHGIRFHDLVEPTSYDYELTGLRPDRRYVLYFGNIRPYKGVLDLLEAWSELAPAYPKHELIVAGRLWSGSALFSRLSGRLLGLASFEKKFRRIRSEIGKESVHFFDQYLREDFINACCRIAELSVFPYKHFHAQSGAATRVAGFGRRLLVSNAGALPELAYSDEFIFKKGDVTDLKDRLSALMSKSPEQIRMDESRQRSYLETCDWYSVADRHWEVYADILNSL